MLDDTNPSLTRQRSAPTVGLAFATVILLGGLGLANGCQTAASAKYIPKEGAPTLMQRGGGCKVYTHLAGQPLDLPHPHQVVGEIESKRSKEQMQAGGEDAIRELEVAACEAGVYGIIDVKVFPGGAMEGGATYIGKAVVFVDDTGEILGTMPAEVDAGVGPVSSTTNEVGVDGGSIVGGADEH